MRAIYRRPSTSRSSPEHPVYPYLLRNFRITRPNQSLPLRRQGGSQFTSLEFTQVLQDGGVKISMDGKGRYQDNIFVERLWRTVKYKVYLKAYASSLEAQKGLEDYFRFYMGSGLIRPWATGPRQRCSMGSRKP